MKINRRFVVGILGLVMFVGSIVFLLGMKDLQQVFEVSDEPISLVPADAIDPAIRVSPQPGNWSLMGILVLGLCALIMAWLYKNEDLKNFLISEGGSGKISTSKLQAFIWSLIVVLAFMGVFGARLFDPATRVESFSLPIIPLNLLLLMGFSAVTVAGAQGLAVSRDNQNKESVENELLKIQMVIWTVVAGAVYLLSIVNYVNKGSYLSSEASLPDVDSTLLVLMGVSQGVYLGGKVVAQREVPTIIKTQTSDYVGASKTFAQEFVIWGANLGDKHNGLLQLEFDFQGPKVNTIRGDVLASDKWTGETIRFQPDATSCPDLMNWLDYLHTQNITKADFKLKVLTDKSLETDKANITIQIK